MLQRLRALQDASATARPTQLLPYLYVSGAVEASSLHVLRHLGITHILNATEDLLLPEESAGFKYPPHHPPISTQNSFSALQQDLQLLHWYGHL